MAEKRKPPVLLVDDEPDILFSLKGLLRREFELYTAESAQQAMQIMAEHPIHVVMTDQRMPEMTGIELLGKVKTEHPDAIRIVFTGYADIKAVIEGINKRGLFRYITKPWDPDELIQVLHEAAAKYDEYAERRRLLADLRALVARIQEVPDESVPATLPELRTAGSDLLARLDQAIEREPRSS